MTAGASEGTAIRRSETAALAALLGLGLAYQLCLFGEGIGLIDEGHLANAARRIATGDVLYRDVYTVYPPASFELVAALFRLLGTSLSVIRGLHIAFTLALALLAYAVARRLMDPPFAWLAGALVAMTGWPVIYEACHYAYLYGAIPMAGLLVLARADAAGALSRGPALAVGALAGLTLAFRLEPFVGLAVAAGGVVLLREGATRRALGPLSWLVAGALLVTLPIGAYYALRGALGDFLGAVFWTSFAQYLDGGELNLPMPALELIPEEWTRRAVRRAFMTWEFRLPVLLYAATMAEFLLAVRRARHAASSASAPASAAVPAPLVARLSLALFGSVIYLRATGRSDYYHLAPILFPAYVLGADWLARAWSRWVKGRARSLAPLASALVLCSSLSLHEVDKVVLMALDDADDVEVVPGGPLLHRDHFLGDLVRDVKARTTIDEPIVVLPWYPIVYFLAERTNPTRFDWLFPGYLKTDGAVAEFIGAIERSSARIVVYSPDSIDGRDDRSLAAFAPQLDGYLRWRFEPVARHGPLWVLRRREGQAQAAPRPR